MIYVVEDDRDISEIESFALKNSGYDVQVYENGADFYRAVRERVPCLVLLDIMLPHMDGFALCREMRRFSDAPVIFITARVMEEDMLNGYALGADDYVTKPFSLPVLYAKAMALTGRVQGINAFVELGGLKADIRSRSVQKGGEIIPLPPKEYEMLLFLMQNPGRVYSREQLLIRFWGYDFDGNERVVDNHIKKLRKAIGSCGCTIDTVRKFGYRLSVVKLEVVR